MAKSRFFLAESSKMHYFCIQKGFIYMQTKILSPMVLTHREQLIKDIEESGILIVRKVNKLKFSTLKNSVKFYLSRI